MNDILAKIIDQKRIEIKKLDARQLRDAAEKSPAPRNFATAVIPADKKSPVKLIAELKRASPSKGILAPHVNMFEVAEIYTKNGASAISVLTDEKFFQGSLNTLRELRFTYASPLPLLRKDFIIHESQIFEAKANGADAILLIASALPDDGNLSDLHACATHMGLTAIVEVHNEAETERALKIPDVKLIGINNRNLSTFEVSLSTTEKLRSMIPPAIGVVAESGIFTAQDVARVARVNVDAVLVGESIITSGNIGAKVQELSSVGRI